MKLGIDRHSQKKLLLHFFLSQMDMRPVLPNLIYDLLPKKKTW